MKPNKTPTNDGVALREEPRPTAAIDAAWRRGDVAGVEAALKEWAREDEVLQSVAVQNTRPHPVTCYLEPWCSELTLAPQQWALVFACGPPAQAPLDRLQVTCDADGDLTVWGWGGSLAYLIAEAQGENDAK